MVMYSEISKTTLLKLAPMFSTSRFLVDSLPHPISYTNHPTVTGSSVIGISCSDCVLVAADTLGSYGSLSRFTSISRIIIVGKFTVVAVTGDYADFQYLSDRLQEKVRQSEIMDDKLQIGPREIYSWLNRVLYYRRTQLNPLWLNLIVAGFDRISCSVSKPFLAYIDMVGTAYEDNSIATGLGSYLVKPLMRKALYNQDGIVVLDRDRGQQLLSECMKVLFYRDCRAYPNYITASISLNGAELTESVQDFGNWSIAEYVHGYD